MNVVGCERFDPIALFPGSIDDNSKLIQHFHLHGCRRYLDDFVLIREIGRDINDRVRVRIFEHLQPHLAVWFMGGLGEEARNFYSPHVDVRASKPGDEIRPMTSYGIGG